MFVCEESTPWNLRVGFEGTVMHFRLLWVQCEILSGASGRNIGNRVLQFPVKDGGSLESWEAVGAMPGSSADRSGLGPAGVGRCRYQHSPVVGGRDHVQGGSRGSQVEGGGR